MSVLSNARQEHSFSTTCIHGSILPSLEYPFSPHALPRLALVWLAFLGVVWLGLRVPESNLASPSENVFVWCGMVWLRLRLGLFQLGQRYLFVAWWLDPLIMIARRLGSPFKCRVTSLSHRFVAPELIAMEYSSIIFSHRPAHWREKHFHVGSRKRHE